MSAIAGRVLLLPKGAYNALTTYNPLDFVTYGADSYVCKQTSTGNAPTNTTYWQLLAKGSTDADQIGYDNTASGLSATDVQAAVDELASEKQDETLSTPIVVGGVSKNTVEDALSGLKDYGDNISDVISKNGAVNLLQNTAESKVDSGVTFTVNADKTVRLSGTASADSALRVNNLTLKAGRYKVVGTPTGGGDTTYQIWLHNTDGLNIDEYGDGTVFTLSADTLVLCDIYIHNGANVTGKVFKPMITLAGQPDSDYAHYVPYAMTNRELTESVSALNSNLSGISNQLINVVDYDLTTWCVNNAVNNGVIFGYFPSTVVGNPSTASGFVQVFAHSADQILIIAYTIEDGGKIYRRIKNVTWGSWKTIIN